MNNTKKNTASSRGVLFDLDGTLLDTLGDLAAAMNLALARLGAPPHPREAYKTFIGDGVEMLVRRALPQAWRSDGDTIRRGLALMQQIYGERWDRETRPYPEIPELLDALGAREASPLGILSNKPHDFVCRLRERLLGGWSFAAVWGARPGVPKKPDPQAALAIARELALLPERWLFVGDTRTDMETARAAGMTAVGVLWGFRGAEELREAGAHHLIDHPLALVELL